MVRPFRRAAAVSLIVIATLASCDILGRDLFPSYLNYEIARADLGALIASEGVTEPYYIPRMLITPERNSPPRVLVYVSAYDGSRLFVFDAPTMKILKTIKDSGVTSFLAVTPSGNYVSGGVEIDASTLAVVSNTRPTMTLWESARAFTDGTDLHVLYMDASGLHRDRYGAAWNLLSSVSAPPLSGVPVNSSTLTDAYCEPSAGSVVRLLFATPSGGRVLSFASSSDFLSAYAFSSLDTGASGGSVNLSGVSDNSGWLTRDGAVVLSYTQNSRIVRCAYSSGSEIDSERLPSSDGDRKVGFEASGSYRLYFDKNSGLLHFMRTWWK